MSVKECLQQLQDEQIAALIALQEAREKEEQRQIEFAEEYTKVDEHRNIQYGLLEELRSVGIVAMLEEATEQPIVIPFRDDTWIANQKEQRVKGLPLTSILTQEDINRSIQRLNIERTREWQVNMPYPKILEGGIWDDTLRINLVRLNRGISGGGLGYEIREYASMSYDATKNLSVREKEVTFTGSLTSTDALDLAAVEMGIAKAMFSPRLEAPSTRVYGRLRSR